MKKRTFLLTACVVLALLLCMVYGNVLAETNVQKYSGNFYYEDMEGWERGITITGYRGTGTDVVIPEKIDGEWVVAISDSAFQNNSNLTSITIPQGVSRIGEYAFASCSNLTSVTIYSEDDLRLGDFAFAFCENLVSVETPSYIACNFGKYAFAFCSKLSSCNFGSFGNNIDIGVFYGCTSLTSIRLPRTLSLKEHTFHGCTNLTSVSIRSGAERIEKDAFHGCTNLTSVDIPLSVIYIADDVFADCSNLTIHCEKGSKADQYAKKHNIPVVYPDAEGSGEGAYKLYVNSSGELYYYTGTLPARLVIPESINGIRVTSIGSSAFQTCYDLYYITFPDSVTSIGAYAFADCDSLSKIFFPNGLKSIGDSAFEDASLGETFIPNSVTKIGEDAFGGGRNFKIYCYKGSTADTYARKNDIPVVYMDDENPTDGGYSLLVNSNGRITGYTGTLPEKLIIPRKLNGVPVTSIGPHAFSDCKTLVSVTIPNSVTTIGQRAFSNCHRLTSITIPNSVTHIGIEAFYRCTMLTSITIPNSVTTIGECAFMDCIGLTGITIPGSVTVLDYWLFKNCVSLTNVTISEGVTDIYDGAFEGCTNLTSITIPNSVTYLGDSVFYGCRSLTSVAIGNGVTSISSYAFDGCTSLPSITIPYNVTSIGYGIFSNCTALRSVIFRGAPKLPQGTTIFDGVPVDQLTLFCFRGTTVEGWAQQLGHKIEYLTGCMIHTEAVIPRKAPTCTESGLTQGVCCTVCDEILIPQETIPATGHNKAIMPAVAPACTEPGFSEGVHCANCGKVFVAQEVIPAKGHELTILNSGFTLKDGDVVRLSDFAEGCEHLDEFILTGVASNESKLAIVDNKLCALDTCFATMPLSIKLPDSFGTEIVITALIHAQKTMNLPAALTEIGEEAFASSAAEEFIIPDGITSIGSRFFANSNLKMIHIPPSVEEIAEDAFAGCDALFIVVAGSYAEAFAQEHSIPYVVQ